MKAIILQTLIVILSALPVRSQTFTNVANQVGINATYYQHNYIPGGGVAIGDIDNDGFPDVIFATADNNVGSGRIKIYKNNNGTFSDITSSSGINFSNTSGLKTIIFGDYNNDGWRDVYITSWYAGNRLYRNNGNSTFTDLTGSAGVGVPLTYQSSTASWGDINNDGFLDLYVGNYGNIESMGEQPNILFRNNGNGTFSDITLAAGVRDTLAKKPLAILCFDYNTDGWQDILIANDKAQRPTLFKNNGNGTFTDVTYTSGILCYADGMGLTIGDINRDGTMDVFLSNGVLGNFLFRNNGNGTFTNVSGPSGISMNKNCWGCNFLDYNNDGWEDLFVAVSLGIDMSDGFFRNNHNNTFTSFANNVGLLDSAQSHGSALCDFNNDGYPDLFVTEVDSNIHVNRNSGGTNNWLKLKCEGTVSNRDAIGSTVTAYYSGTLTRKVILGGSSYLSCDDVVQIFGIGTASVVDSLTINWTNGMRETAYNLASNRIYYALEGSGLIGIQIISSEIPQSYILSQNYPNPFNPSTKINFSVPVSGMVNLKVYDVNGREIVTLISQNMKPGIYSVNFDANNLAGGVYFYELRAKGFAQTKKMLIIK